MKIPIYNIYYLLLAMMLMVGIVGCSKIDSPEGGTPLPEGQYHLELTSQMDEIVSRATTDNTWAGGENVSMMVAGTPSATIKNYTASPAGILSAKSGVKPFYWTLSSEIKTVSAWYPYSASTPANFTINASQSSTGYAESDFLYAAPKTIAFTDAAKSLTFKHLPAKVVFNIKKGDGITDAEIQDATVTIANQSLTSGAITLSTGAVAQATSGSADVAPYALTAASGFQKSVQALLVPCQMQNKVFIKIAINSDTFGYTPTNATDGNLQSGNCYTYEITVKRNSLEVKLTENSAWTNDGITDVESKVVPKIGDYYYSDNTYSTTYNNSKTCIGIVFWVDGSGGGKIISMDEGKDRWRWNVFDTGARDWNNGIVNMAVIKSITNIFDGYEAFAWCDAKNDANTDYTSATTGVWYLPAINELKTICNQKSIMNTALAKASGTQFSEDDYWSSTDSDFSNAYYYNFKYNYNMTNWKYFGKKLRAVSAF